MPTCTRIEALYFCTAGHLHLGSGGGLLQGSTHFDDSPCLPVAGELLLRC